MKTTLKILGAAALCQGALFACGEEAPAPINSSDSVTNEDGPMPSGTPQPSTTVGMLSPSPMATLPPAAPPPQATGTAQPMGTVPPSGGTSNPLTPPMPPVNTQPMPTTAQPTPTIPPSTPTPVDTPAVEPEPAPVAGGEGNLLVPNSDGWIDASTNGVGVKGGWYAYDDGNTTGYEEIVVTDGEVCMSGTNALQEDPADQWGSGMGLVLNDGGEGVQDPWDGSAYAGFSFAATISADSPVTIEVVMDGVDPPHEATLSSGANTINWSDLAQPDWATDTTTFDPSEITKVQIKVATLTTGTVEFDVCLSDFTVLE